MQHKHFYYYTHFHKLQFYYFQKTARGINSEKNKYMVKCMTGGYSFANIPTYQVPYYIQPKS